MTTSESKGRFFLQNESIRVTNGIESIRIANWNALLNMHSSAYSDHKEQRLDLHDSPVHVLPLLWSGTKCVIPVTIIPDSRPSYSIQGGSKSKLLYCDRYIKG